MKYNHYHYCENLARTLKAVNHTDSKTQYYEATEQTELHELEQNIVNASGTILIAIDGQMSNYNFNNDSLVENPVYSIVIAKQTKSTDARTITKAQQDCKGIANQVIYKILCDGHRYKHHCDLVDGNSFVTDGFGPIAGNFYGVILSYSLDVPTNFTLDNEYWQ